MLEPERIATALLDGSDGAAAAFLVALHDRPGTVLNPDDWDIHDDLTAAGCIDGELITALGNQVAMILRARGVRPLGSDA